MKRILLTAALCAALLGTQAGNADYNVIPMPQSVTPAKGGPFRLDATVKIVYTGDDELMKSNADFLSRYIDETVGMKLQTTAQKDKKAPYILLTADPKMKEQEGYRIQVNNKAITIAGATPAGVFHGIQTLRKSLAGLTQGEEVLFPAADIADAPRFGYRAMMLDCARHFFPVAFVKQFIDMLALHNMNTFHWHLTDDQGWRLEIERFPLLTKISSMRESTVIGRNSDVEDGLPYGGFYTKEEAREIVEYARKRHITVIPEIDMPGHMVAALAAYPHLGCTGKGYKVGSKWGVYRDVLCIGNEDTYAFVQGIIDELTEIFPSEYIHIGGDETPTERWESCPKCRKLAQEHQLGKKQLQAYFTNRMEKYINGKGRRIIGWNEIAEGDISPTATIMSWTGAGPGYEAAKKGHDIIMSPTSHMYFDYYQSDKKDHEPLSIGGLVTMETVYDFDPVPDSLDAAAKRHVIGVQANIWTEYIATTNHVEYMALPRMAALAEVQWTPAARKDYGSFKLRMDKLAKMYDRYKWNYGLQLWPERSNYGRWLW